MNIPFLDGDGRYKFSMIKLILINTVYRANKRWI